MGIGFGEVEVAVGVLQVVNAPTPELRKFPNKFEICGCRGDMVDDTDRQW